MSKSVFCAYLSWYFLQRALIYSTLLFENLAHCKSTGNYKNKMNWNLWEDFGCLTVCNVMQSQATGPSIQITIWHSRDWSFVYHHCLHVLDLEAYLDTSWGKWKLLDDQPWRCFRKAKPSVNQIPWDAVPPKALKDLFGRVYMCYDVMMLCFSFCCMREQTKEGRRRR